MFGGKIVSVLNICRAFACRCSLQNKAQLYLHSACVKLGIKNNLEKIKSTREDVWGYMQMLKCDATLCKLLSICGFGNLQWLLEPVHYGCQGVNVFMSGFSQVTVFWYINPYNYFFNSCELYFVHTLYKLELE